MDLAKKVANTIEQYGLGFPGDRMVVGLSGGADSLCLAEVLRELGFSLHAVHVHHGLRESADRDADFVAEYCRAHSVPLTVVHVRAGEYAAEHGLSTEEAGRILRRQAFEEAVRVWEESDPLRNPARAYHIALAHHLEDSAETFLFNLCRGSRITGMSGICPAAGTVIHPLLTCSREEIETYLREKGFVWCTDETNESDAYTRNRIRHGVLPILKNEVNPAAVRHIAAAALEAAECEDYLKSETDRAAKKCLKKDGQEICIDLQQLNELPLFLKKRVLYAALTAGAGQKKDIEAAHVEQLLRLTETGGSGRKAVLPYGLHAYKTYSCLYIGTGSLSLPHSAAGEYPAAKEDYETRVFARPTEPFEIPTGEYTKWFDYDKIAPAFLFRTPREGDRITLGRDGARKRLSRCFIDGKVPRELRKTIVLAASGDEILWIPGFRISAAYPVTENTKTILEIRLRDRKPQQEP